MGPALLPVNGEGGDSSRRTPRGRCGCGGREGDRSRISEEANRRSYVSHDAGAEAVNLQRADVESAGAFAARSRSRNRWYRARPRLLLQKSADAQRTSLRRRDCRETNAEVSHRWYPAGVYTQGIFRGSLGGTAQSTTASQYPA